jgi:hypothetical protein
MEIDHDYLGGQGEPRVAVVVWQDLEVSTIFGYSCANVYMYALTQQHDCVLI